VGNFVEMFVNEFQDYELALDDRLLRKIQVDVEHTLTTTSSFQQPRFRRSIITNAMIAISRQETTSATNPNPNTKTNLNANATTNPNCKP